MTTQRPGAEEREDAETRPLERAVNIAELRHEALNRKQAENS